MTSCGDASKKVDHSKLSLDSLIVLYPDSVELLVRKGNEYMEKSDYQKALEIAAKAYLLVDLTSGQVLAAKDPDQAVEPASLTKLMSAY